MSRRRFVLCVAGTETRGAVFGSSGSRRFAAAFDSEDMDFTIQHSEDWYRERLADATCPAVPEGP